MSKIGKPPRIKIITIAVGGNQSLRTGTVKKKNRHPRKKKKPKDLRPTAFIR